MDLHEMIETAAKQCASVRELAQKIGVSDSNLTAAKAGRRGLPNSACGKLAEILNIDRWVVVAASDLVTEKNPEKRAYLTPFVLALPRKAATWIIAIASAAMIGTPAPTEAHAHDTFNESANAGNALPASNSGASNWHYVYLPIGSLRSLRSLTGSPQRSS
jgi:hypothetical protein